MVERWIVVPPGVGHNGGLPEGPGPCCQGFFILASPPGVKVDPSLNLGWSGMRSRSLFVLGLVLVTAAPSVARADGGTFARTSLASHAAAASYLPSYARQTGLACSSCHICPGSRREIGW